MPFDADARLLAVGRGVDVHLYVSGGSNAAASTSSR
jgi:hypothetical protein